MKTKKLKLLVLMNSDNVCIRTSEKIILNYFHPFCYIKNDVIVSLFDQEMSDEVVSSSQQLRKSLKGRYFSTIMSNALLKNHTGNLWINSKAKGWISVIVVDSNIILTDKLDLDEVNVKIATGVMKILSSIIKGNNLKKSDVLILSDVNKENIKKGIEDRDDQKDFTVMGMLNESIFDYVCKYKLRFEGKTKKTTIFFRLGKNFHVDIYNKDEQRLLYEYVIDKFDLFHIADVFKQFFESKECFLTLYEILCKIRYLDIDQKTFHMITTTKNFENTVNVIEVETLELKRALLKKLKTVLELPINQLEFVGMTYTTLFSIYSSSITKFLVKRVFKLTSINGLSMSGSKTIGIKRKRGIEEDSTTVDTYQQLAKRRKTKHHSNYGENMDKIVIYGQSIIIKKKHIVSIAMLDGVMMNSLERVSTDLTEKPKTAHSIKFNLNEYSELRLCVLKKMKGCLKMILAFFVLLHEDKMIHSEMYDLLYFCCKKSENVDITLFNSYVSEIDLRVGKFMKCDRLFKLFISKSPLKFLNVLNNNKKLVIGIVKMCEFRIFSLFEYGLFNTYNIYVGIANSFVLRLMEQYFEQVKGAYEEWKSKNSSIEKLDNKNTFWGDSSKKTLEYFNYWESRICRRLGKFLAL